MKRDLEALFDESDLTQEAVGQVLGITASAVCNKMAGRRPWVQAEMDKVLALLSERLGRRVLYEEAFGSVIQYEAIQ